MSHQSDGRALVFFLIMISLVILWEHRVHVCSSSVFGLLLGMFASFWLTFDSFNPEFFLYILLPPILLNSAFKFQMDSLKNWLSSLTFATVGTVISMLWIAWGLLVWPRGTTVEMAPISALLFASILAPTDTVATISLSKKVDVAHMYIFTVLENESVMNDALSVVLVRLFSTLKNAHEDVDRWVPIEVIVSMIVSTCLSILLGFFFLQK